MLQTPVYHHVAVGTASLIGVEQLFEPDVLVEVEATAILD